MFFTAAQKFGLEKHFDPNCRDVRVQLRELFERTKQTIARERQINLEIVLLIACLEMKNAAVNLGVMRRDEMAVALGLTPNQYWKRAQAGRVLTYHPEFIALIEEKKTHVSHVALLAPKITQANKEIFLEELPGKSEREVRMLVAAVKKDGTRKETQVTVNLTLQLTGKQLQQLDRAREVLSCTGKVPSDEEVLMKAVEDLLEKRDPLRKAERSRRRQNRSVEAPSVPKGGRGSNPSPVRPSSAPKGGRPLQRSHERSPSAPKGGRFPLLAAMKHQVYLRDGGQCTYRDGRGNRCTARQTLQIDHVRPVGAGGTNEVANLRLLCREHNVAEGVRWFGSEKLLRFTAASQSTI